MFKRKVVTAELYPLTTVVTYQPRIWDPFVALGYALYVAYLQFRDDCGIIIHARKYR
jgi:hypothetical protein